MHTKHRNLFIEIHLPDTTPSQASLLNNWTRPPPLEFHVVNSPALTHHLSLLSPQDKQKPALSQMAVQSKKYQSRGLHGDRLKYHRFEQELEFLQQFLLQFKDLRASEILAYRQTLLVRYLGELVTEINSECKEKGHFLQSIWNAFIRIFQEVFERVVNDSKLKEKESLKESINLHEEYQNRLEALTQANKHLQAEEAKATAVIQQLANNIAMLNVELKGTRALQDKSSVALKELTHKYEELRTQHIQLLTTSNAITWNEAETRLHDQQLLLFSKKVANSQIAIKVKPKAKRRGRVLNNNLEVELLLQELEAESEYSFSLNSSIQQEQKVRYVHQRVQTMSIRKEENQAIDQSTQHIDLPQKSQAETQTQTLPKQTTDRGIQASFKDSPRQVRLKLQSCLNFNAKLQFDLQVQNKRGETEISQAQRALTIKTEEAISQKNISVAEQMKHKSSIRSKERNSGKLSESKMFRVGEGSKLSKRGSNVYRQKQLKTEGASDTESINYSVKRQSSEKKVSQLLLIEELRQDYIRNYSRFKSGTKMNFPEQLRMFVHQNLEGNRFQQGLVPAGGQVSIRSPRQQLQNIQFSVAYPGLIEKIRDAMSLDRRKKIPPAKCMKEASYIFKMAAKFVNQGVFSLDIIAIAEEYLSAIEGKHLTAELKQRKFIEFVVSCIPLASSSYLIKSLLLLCGLPFGRTYYLRTSKAEKPREEDRFDKDSSKYVFSSEVYTYFKLLTMANCHENEEIAEAFTNEDRFLDSLRVLPVLYKGSEDLFQEIKTSVRQSIQQSVQKNPKLDIFKSLHLVIDKVLVFKTKIIQSLEPLVILIKNPDLSFAEHIISLFSDDPNTRFICLQVLKTLYSAKYTAQNLGTMAIIEGLEIETYKFTAVEQEHKFAILKRLMPAECHQDRLLEAMIKAIPKKELRKQQFLILLRLLWIRQADRLIDNILGEDLGALYGLGVGLTLKSPHKDSFHSMAFDNVFQ